MMSCVIDRDVRQVMQTNYLTPHVVTTILSQANGKVWSILYKNSILKVEKRILRIVSENRK